MFKWRLKRLMEKMDAWTSIAQMTASLAALHYIDPTYIDRAPGSSADPPGSEAEKTTYRKAAAMTNYLFGYPPSELHLEKLDLVKERKTAIDWLRQDALFRELVVQSLRVMMMINFGRNSDSSIIGEEVLCTFGSEYPAAPDIDNYPALVRRAIDSLPPDSRASLKRWIRSQSSK